MINSSECFKLNQVPFSSALKLWNYIIMYHEINFWDTTCVVLRFIIYFNAVDGMTDCKSARNSEMIPGGSGKIVERENCDNVYFMVCN